ncbi:MAG: hypothetical protein ABIF77_00280 [bacterium]
MNTERSDALAQEFLQQSQHVSHKVIEFGGDLPADPETLFPLLCPTRECDWIPGWTCELLYTESGYVENGCVFRTSVDNYSGPGIWVITRHEPPRLLELVRFMPQVVMQLKIELTANRDGTTRSDWTLTFTGLDAEGSALIDEIPTDGDEHQRPLQLLTHYLQTGDMTDVSAAEQRHGSAGNHHSVWDRLKGHLGG